MRFKFFDFKKLLISIFVFCICLVGGGYAGSKFFNAPKEKINEEFSDAETPLMTIPTDGTTPKDHSILDNLQIAASVIKSNPHFKGITTGHAITNMVIQNDQNVYTERRVDGEYSYVNTITSSSFVKSATQKFFNGKSSPKVFMRDGKVNDDNFAESTFDDSKEPRVYERNAFLEIYGWTPYQLCSYIFRDDSVILEESKVIEDSSYFYAAEVKCEEPLIST
jgi:hypothetical protein